MGVSQYKELAAGLSVMLENGQTNPADMMKGFFFFYYFCLFFSSDSFCFQVHRSFTASDNVPPVSFLRNSAFLDMLVDDLFITSRELPSKYQDK